VGAHLTIGGRGAGVREIGGRIFGGTLLPVRMAVSGKIDIRIVLRGMVRKGQIQGGLATVSKQRPARGKGWCIMALGIYFVHEGFTPEKYNNAIKQLDSAGAGAPKGRTLHVALESDGSIHVFDIWESQEDFDAFGPTLMPILTELGVGLKEPMVAQVHNVIKG